jgi:regulator of protease activity HflC (stomatin/prohibitin superfamily)
MESEQLEEARRQAQAIVDRAERDETFRGQLQSDPDATLRAEGLAEEAIPEFVNEVGLADVAGYAARVPTLLILCCGVSCILTSPKTMAAG